MSSKVSKNKISKKKLRKQQMVKAKIRSIMPFVPHHPWSFTVVQGKTAILDDNPFTMVYIHRAGTVITARITVRVVMGAHHIRTFDGTGYSKRHPTDPSDHRFGTELAIDRALDDLAKEIIRYDKPLPPVLSQCFPM